MTHVDWERAELTLPAAAVPAVKQALRDKTNQVHQLARAAAEDFWNRHAQRTRSTKVYRKRLEAYIMAEKPGYGQAGTRTHISGLRYPLTEQLFEMLESAAARPHKLTAAEVAAYFPQANNRTVRFSAGAEASIACDARRLTWGCAENNHSVQYMHAHPVFVALMNALRGVTWTRGSGGSSWGCDEYAMDAAVEHGDDPVSVTGRWGPLGQQS